MPAPANIDEFLDVIRKSELVPEDRLRTFLDTLRARSSLPSEPNRLADLMVRDGLLTYLHAECLLFGKYRGFEIGGHKVLERLGSGDMCAVYLCDDSPLGRRVAIKVLPTARAQDSIALARLLNEARALAALYHPNIVKIHAMSRVDQLHFIVMEHVDGPSLRDVVEKTGPMNVTRAAHYIRQAALALQHVHDTRLVHRDVEPGNVLVDRSGVVKLIDLGLVRVVSDDAVSIGRNIAPIILGTPDYMSPEHAVDSRVIDGRADVYSLGATFYYCLAGAPPFPDGTDEQKMNWHQTRQPRPIRELRPEVPEGMAAVLDRMMAKDRAHRYQTALAVAEALAPWTQTPIPPPPENEMPRLSPAARGA